MGVIDRFIRSIKKILHIDKFKHFHNDIKDVISLLYGLNDNLLSDNHIKFLNSVIHKLNHKKTKPFWNDKVEDFSKLFWLPSKAMKKFLKKIKLVLNFSTVFICSKKIKVKNLIKPTDKEPSINVTYTRKIRIFPNDAQHQLFAQCLGTTRFIYNQGVDFINKEFEEQKAKLYALAKEGCIKCKKELHNTFFCKKHRNCKIPWKLTTSHIGIRNAVLINDADLPEDLKWQSDIPYDTRQLPLKSLAANYKSARSNYKNGHINGFKLGFKSKKDKSQVFFSDKRALKDFGIFKTRLKKSCKIRTRKRYDKYKSYKPTNDFIVMKKSHKYYILLTKTKDTTYQKAKYNTVALDPGVRTFETFYSPDGLVGKLGDGLNIQIRKLHEQEDKLLSLITKTTGRKKRNLKRRVEKIRDKAKAIVNDQHWKICAFLCEYFENIIIPQFGVKDMSKKEGRNISKRITREMLSLSHGVFLEKLKYKCSENQRNLYIVTEEYTTKTCGCCGTIKEVGSSKVYNCETCGTVIDRDYNGARNIYLKALLGLDTTP